MAEGPDYLNRFLHHTHGNAARPAHINGTSSIPDAHAGRRRSTIQEAGTLIIVIDDEATVLLALNVLLETWGYRVLAAESEGEAVEKLSGAGDPPQAIIADYRLREGRTGVEAIRRIRSMVGAEVPSIIITGDTSTDGLREARASGVTVLQKPVPPPHLKAVLTRALTPVGPGSSEHHPAGHTKGF